eukprot:8648557-Prorocentrum_lima.AAC.1
MCSSSVEARLESPCSWSDKDTTVWDPILTHWLGLICCGPNRLKQFGNFWRVMAPPCTGLM